MLKLDGDHYTCGCAKCSHVLHLASSTLEGAHLEVRDRGWMDQARRGQGVARWTWLCPKCRPNVAGAALLGPTTPDVGKTRD